MAMTGPGGRSRSGTICRRFGRWAGSGLGGVAANRNRQRPAHLAHLLGAQMTDEADEARAFHRLDMVEVHSRFVLESLSDPYGDLTRRAANRRGDGSDHHGVEQSDDFLTGQNENRANLVGRGETVAPDL